MPGFAARAFRREKRKDMRYIQSMPGRMRPDSPGMREERRKKDMFRQSKRAFAKGFARDGGVRKIWVEKPPKTAGDGSG